LVSIVLASCIDANLKLLYLVVRQFQVKSVSWCLEEKHNTLGAGCFVQWRHLQKRLVYSLHVYLQHGMSIKHDVVLVNMHEGYFTVDKKSIHWLARGMQTLIAISSTRRAHTTFMEKKLKPALRLSSPSELGGGELQ